MIRVFGQTDTIFTSNGDIVLSPLKAKIHKRDNSEYYLELETGLEYIDFIVEGNIVVANTPTGDQAFRLGNVTKTQHKLVSKCNHVFYDSRNYLIADSYVVDMNCNDALNHLNNATEPTSEFTTHSDVGNVDSFRCVRKSFYEAIQTVIDRWGGHLVRDNFDISIKANIGVDNGIIIQYKKNLKDITTQENWDNVVTKLLPVGKDGLLLNALDPNAEIYVESSMQYSLPYTKTVTFTQDEINQENYPNETAYVQALVNDLYSQALDYLEINQVPQINYTLKANLDKVTDIGDTVEVIDERLGINLMTYVIGFVYDCIFGQYTEVEFGNFTNTLSGLIGNITASVDKTVSAQVQSVTANVEEQINAKTEGIMNILDASYVIYNGDNVLVVDTLPKENATKVIKMDNNGISISNEGINGAFSLVWSIDGSFNAGNLEILNLAYSMIKSGTLSLGSNSNNLGVLKLYDPANNVICQMDSSGLTMFAQNGSYISINNQDGFICYDRNENILFSLDGDEFKAKRLVATENLTLFNEFNLIPITITQGNSTINDGIGLVPIASGG